MKSDERDSGWLMLAGDLFTACAERMGCKIDTINTMRGAMERAGFVNFQEKNYKVPFGTCSLPQP